MLALYRAKDQVSVVSRVKALNALIIMLNKKWEKLDIKIDWKPFWQELLAIINREFRYELSGSESILVQHVNKLAAFIAKARPYYDLTDSGKCTSTFGDVVEFAASKLSDLRSSDCIEGPLALMSCLPTNWAHYDEVLPSWLDLWSSINHNNAWDQCWVVIISRAVKYSKTFDWKPYVPFLLSKIKDLLQLPSAEGRREQSSNSFPRSFPSYYSFVFSYIKDNHQNMLLKLTKILVKTMMRDGSEVPADLSSITISSVVKDVLEKRSLKIVGFNTVSGPINETTKAIMDFLHSLRPFVHPSNNGNYVLNIATFLVLLVRTAGSLLGKALIDNLAKASDSQWVTGKGSALFLSGYVFSFLLDGIYTKNMRVNRTYHMGMKHIIPLQPDTIHVICAYFLEVLQPKASNQSFQTMVAMMSLSVCVRLGLFPQPYMLEYIPDILKSSLAGLEASDSSKTMLALDLLSNIFGWLPLSKSYKPHTPRFASYVDLIDSRKLDEQPFSVASEIYRTQYDDFLRFVTDGWAAQVFEKIFVLIDSEELKVKGSKESPISSTVSYFVSMFFQSMEDLDASFESDIERLLLNYITQRAPAHTNKTCGKLLEYFIAVRPHRLNAVLKALLTPDFLSLSMSAEKLMFRLRVIGACFRQGQGVEIDAENGILFDLLTRKALLYHEDIKVRKHIGKLYKDMLKGAVSVYPTKLYARYTHNSLLGAPNLVREGDIEWFVPTEGSMRQSVALLSRLTTFCLDEINTALSAALGEAVDSSVLVYKKIEEIVGTNLATLRRLVRGAAEILTEDYSEKDLRQINLNTGREASLLYLSESEQQYVKSYRAKLFSALNNIHVQLEQTAKTEGFSGLRNNEFIAKQWMKLVHVLFTRRTGFCKDVDRIRKWIEASTGQGRVALCASAYKRMKELGISSLSDGTSSNDSLVSTLGSAYYWKRHDWNANSIGGYFWLQHCTRAITYSQCCSRVLFRGESTEDPVFQTLAYLLDLTRHQYDEIRPHARKIFEKLSRIFGHRLNGYISSLLSLLRVSEANYYQTASTLVTLKQSTMLRRIQTDRELKAQFLECLPYVQTIAATIDGEEKREKIMLSLADIFVKYIQGWSVTKKDLAQLQQRLFPPILSSFGFTAENSENTSFDLISIVSNGLRLDTFNAFILLHLISDRVMELDAVGVPLVQFVMKQLCTSHGQPVQLLVNSILYRIVEIANHEPAESLANKQWYQLLRTYLDPLHSQSQWSGFALGMVRVLIACSGGSDGTRTQWSRGVSEVIAGNGFLATIKPRQAAHRRNELSFYSNIFSYEFALTFCSMLELGLVPIFDNPQGPPSQVIEKLFDYMNALLSSIGENEKRVVNDLRAEMFGAILRCYLQHSHRFDAATDALLAKYLREQTESASTDYLRDWQEALYFATETATNVAFVESTQIVSTIVANFAALLISSNSLASVNEDATVSVSDDGILRYDRTIMLLNAVLNGLSTSELWQQRQQGVVQPHLSLASKIAAILSQAEVNVVLPYRSSRSEITSTIMIICDVTGLKLDLSAVFQKFLCAAVSSSPIVPTSSAMDVDNADDPDVPSIAASEDAALGNGRDPETVRRQNAVESVSFIISRAWFRLQQRDSLSLTLPLVPALLQGVSETKIETVKLSTESLLNMIHSLKPTDAASPSSAYTEAIATLAAAAKHAVWRVREVAVRCAVLVLANAWCTLVHAQRQQLKDIFAEALKDPQQNVQEMAQSGMVAYLAYKTDKELQTIAEAYTRNSETLAARYVE